MWVAWIFSSNSRQESEKMNFPKCPTFPWEPLECWKLDWMQNTAKTVRLSVQLIILSVLQSFRSTLFGTKAISLKTFICKDCLVYFTICLRRGKPKLNFCANKKQTQECFLRDQFSLCTLPNIPTFYTKWSFAGLTLISLIPDFT